MVLKMGVLSDTHLSRVSRDLKEIVERHFSDADMILHAGDYVSPEVVGYLMKKRFRGVHGNMDTTEIKQSLPDQTVIEMGPYKIGLIHGWGPSEGLEERIWDTFQGVDVVVYGHSHKAANHEREGVLLFNPGTATGYTSSGVNSVGLLELGESVRGTIIEIA